MPGKELDIVPPQTIEEARELPSNILYALEVAGEISKEILDDRVRMWTGEDKSQRWIAGELGCSRKAIRNRQERMGLTSSHPRAVEIRAAANARSQLGPAGPIIDAELLAEEDNGPADMPNKTRQNAGAAKRRIETIVGTCQGLEFLDRVNAESALKVATKDERKAWIKALSDGEKALRQFRKRIEEGAL